jgi:hypothetical protein
MTHALPTTMPEVHLRVVLLKNLWQNEITRVILTLESRTFRFSDFLHFLSRNFCSKVAGELWCGQFYTLTRFPTCSAGSRPLKRSLGFRIVFVICPPSLTAWITMHIHLVSRRRPLKRSTACPPLLLKSSEFLQHQGPVIGEV